MVRMLLQCVAALALVVAAAAHGGLTFPPPRNNFGNVDPRNTSRQPGSVYGPQGGPCSGDECLWFSEGCYIGCPSCSSDMPKEGNYFGPVHHTLEIKMAPKSAFEMCCAIG